MTANATPDWRSVTLDPKFTWTSGTSANGVPFKIGTPIEATNDASDAAEQSKTPFDIQVNWTGGPVRQNFGIHVTPSAEETRITSITSYYISTTVMNYVEFDFQCTETYDFRFYDATGDSYRNNVFWARPGTLHTIMYFSSNPTIVRITGS